MGFTRGILLVVSLVAASGVARARETYESFKVQPTPALPPAGGPRAAVKIVYMMSDDQEINYPSAEMIDALLSQTYTPTAHSVVFADTFSKVSKLQILGGGALYPVPDSPR